MGRPISSEKLWSVLLAHGTVKEAAWILKVSEKAIWSKMGEDDFLQMYDHERGRFEKACGIQYRALMNTAMGCLGELVKDENASAETRVAAAQMILEGVALHYFMNGDYIGEPIKKGE